MEQQRFDELVRNLGTSNSRRTVLKGLLAGAVTGIVGAVSGGSALAKQDDSKKDNKGQSKKPDCCPDAMPNLCDLQCVDTQSDPHHCGVCGNDCGPNGVCVNGICACADGTTQCDGSCIDTTNDVNNCGVCGNTCSSGQTCVNGICTTANCDDGNPCTNDVFDAGSGSCISTPVSDGTPCESDSGSGTCVSGVCVTSSVCSQGQSQSCNTGMLGVCAVGTQSCTSAGTWGPCVPTTLPQTETCNGLDDDCDGVVDNGASCGAGMICDQGTCVPSTCTPDCVGKQCGDDGCGGSCGDCTGAICDGNSVQAASTCNAQGTCDPGATESCGVFICSGGSCLQVCSGNQDCAAGFTCQGGNCVPIDLQNDVNNCGQIGRVCSASNATMACSGGECVIDQCNAGFSDCNNNPADGCEVNTGIDHATTAAHAFMYAASALLVVRPRSACQRQMARRAQSASAMGMGSAPNSHNLNLQWPEWDKPTPAPTPVRRYRRALIQLLR